MTDQECLQAFGDLEVTLRELGLGWVLDQVNSLLSVGRLEVVQVATVPAPSGAYSQQSALVEPEQVSRRGGRKADFAKAVAYSPRERLTGLLDAISTAIVQTVQMESEADLVVTELLRAGGIDLANPDTGTQVPLKPSRERLTSTAVLNDVLFALRQEVADG